MSRRNLTSNKRSFNKNPRNFLDKISEAPLIISIDDGVNPAYDVIIDSKTGSITNSDDLPPGTNIDTRRDNTDTNLP